MDKLKMKMPTSALVYGMLTTMVVSIFLGINYVDIKGKLVETRAASENKNVAIGQLLSLYLNSIFIKSGKYPISLDGLVDADVDGVKFDLFQFVTDYSASADKNECIFRIRSTITDERGCLIKLSRGETSQIETFAFTVVP